MRVRFADEVVYVKSIYLVLGWWGRVALGWFLSNGWRGG